MNFNIGKVQFKLFKIDPVNIYLFKVNSRNSRRRCEIFSKLTMKAPARRD